MYTQCSICETVFKLSAETLRAAGGQVRCGKCGEVFNALARLAEDSSSFTTGESPLDLEVRADSILESIGAPQVAQAVAKDYEEFGPPGVEIAQLEVLDWAEDDQSRPGSSLVEDYDERLDEQDVVVPMIDDQSLEFSLPPGELDRIFIESKKRSAPPAALIKPESDPPADAVPASAPDRSAAPEPPPHLERRARFEVPEVPDDVRRDMLEGFEQTGQPDVALRSAGRTGTSRRGFIIWLGAATVVALMLAAQIIYRNPEWFAAHVGRFFGAPPPPPLNLSAYQLRQWGVSGDPDANGNLRVRASILNTAAQLQPYPLLRVTLADRFGKRIGSRDFEPSEYLGKPIARMLAPGERVDATLRILDPGKNAEGFEIDVCLHGAQQKISCANDAAAQSKR